MSTQLPQRARPSRMIPLTAALSLTIAWPLLGDDIQWTNSLGGDYDVGTNWSGGTPPGELDVSVFDLNNPYTVTFNQDEIAFESILRFGTVTWDLNGWIYTLGQDTQGGTLRLGEQSGDEVNLTLINGTVVTRRDAIVGFAPGSTGHLVLDGSAARLEAEHNDGLYVGDDGNGTLEILNGASTYFYDYIIGQHGTGTALIDGAGSEMRSTNFTNCAVYVGGQDGIGTLTVTNGGAVARDGYLAMRVGFLDGEVLVNGPDSVLDLGALSEVGLEIGGGGTGTVTISGGATIPDMIGETWIGSFGGHGEYYVTGGGTTVYAESVRLGYDGSTGYFEVSDGALFDAGSWWIRAYGSSDVLFTGASTSVTCDDFLSDIDATCTISEGASLFCGGINDYGPGLLITDTDTYVECANIDVYGFDGNTAFTIQNGAHVFVPQGILARVSITDGGSEFTSELNVDGTGTLLDIEGELKVAAQSEFDEGTVNITNGAEIIADTVTLGDGGTINGEVTIRDQGGGPGLSVGGLVAKTLVAEAGGTLSDTTIDVQAGGTVTGDGIVPANVINSGGRIAPGIDANALSINGSYDQFEAAGMRIRMQGWYNWDVLNVISDATISGELFIEVPDEWDPPFGRTYEFLTANSIVGEFDTIASNSAALEFEMTYHEDSVEFTVVNPITLEVQNLVAGEDATFIVRGGTPGAQAAVLYGTRLGDGAFKSGSWCVDFGFKVSQQSALSRLVVQGAFNQNGMLGRSKRIPANVSGLHVYLQAAQNGTCPEAVMSNLVDEVIQ